MGRCEHTPSVGPLLLGALGRAEEQTLERHAADCLDCNHELRSLEPVRRALLTAGPVLATIEDLPEEPPDRVERALMARAIAEDRRRRRERRVKVLAVAAVALVVVATSAGVFLRSQRSRSEGPSYAITTAPAGVSGQVTVWEKPWGSYALVQASGLPAGTSYRLWFEESGGARVPMGSFTGTGPTPIHCVGVAATTLQKAVAVGASGLDGRDVFRAELAAGPTDRKPAETGRA